jgi:hypothetical protein
MRIITVFAIGAVMLHGVAPAQSFEVSGKPIEMTWPTQDWKGQHSFPPVFCLTYPNPWSATSLVQVMFNQNTLYLARVTYRSNIAIYVATSTTPADRTPADEIEKLLSANRLSERATGGAMHVSELSTDFGPTVGIVIRNAVEGGASAPFPFVRKIAMTPDGSLQSLSVHRLFVRGPDRFEVAGLQYFGSPVEESQQEQAIARLTSAVNAVVSNLQTCTATMTIRSRK